MQSWEYEIGDVLLIAREGSEVVARVAGFVDQLDDTKPMYVNLRTIDDGAWKRSIIKVWAIQIVKPLPTWEAELTVHVDEMWSKMSEADKRRVHKQAVELGFAQPDRRSPLDVMIDRACGLE